jgi:alkylation response protein AidB-like acyl-CoA dehydrogenase
LVICIFNRNSFSDVMTYIVNIACVCYLCVDKQGLSKGAINTLYAHGDEALKQKYMHRMVSGEWTGTMCLTEPQVHT